MVLDGANKNWLIVKGNCKPKHSKTFKLNLKLFHRCPLDGEIMGQFEYSDDRSKATVSFPAHKFPYTSSVYYQCNVRLCALNDPECQQVIVKIDIQHSDSEIYRFFCTNRHRIAHKIDLNEIPKKQTTKAILLQLKYILAFM